jgi:diadenosine tetraphosphatase ApaH/serine/threonine PP2A family protein phosphatase
MRYAIFTDIHANLEALEAVLAKIDEIANKEPIDQIWFLGDLVGYGPDPNECIRVLRERTNVIIAGNHDWAAVGKIDLEDFSAAARVSAEWTAEQLTPEHREFLTNLPERLEIDGCTLVHGSPFGPLWEYLTSEALAERSFLYFDTRYCLVGHTHVPVIFIQPDAANIPTLPLSDVEQAPPITLAATNTNAQANGANHHHEQIDDGSALEEANITDAPPETSISGKIDESADAGDADDDETVELVMAQHQGQQPSLAVETLADSAFQEPHSTRITDNSENADNAYTPGTETPDKDDDETETAIAPLDFLAIRNAEDAGNGKSEDAEPENIVILDDDERIAEEENNDTGGDADVEERSPEVVIADAEERLTSEIEELLNLLGLSQSMVEVTNQMLTPPEGHWDTPSEHRAIINPGGVGQPRDGDSRAAFMIYDTERGFEFYRIPYDFEVTQDKILKAGLPQFLAARLAYGR